MALDATISGPEANSYATVAEAEAYFATRLFSNPWSALDGVPQREAALITATRMIEYRVQNMFPKTDIPDDATVRRLTNVGDQDSTTIVWNGVPATNEQALSWPRTGLSTRNGAPLGSDIIPMEIKHLQFEIAVLCASSDRLAESQVASLGLSGLKAGPVELRFNQNAPNPTIVPNSLFQGLPRNWWYAFELVYHQASTFKVL